MSDLIKQINKVNNIYHTMKKNYDILKKMFHNHKSIENSIILSERILSQAFGKIMEKTEEVETKREFNKIIKEIRNEIKNK